MNLIFLGPPGAGKGTQSDAICSKFSIPKISTGDILRQARKDQTELGKRAETFMLAGKLVPDEIVIGIVNERLAQDDCSRGFILDGFPRTVGQADALSSLLGNSNRGIKAVLSLDVPDDSLISRLTGRRVCQECGASFHIQFAPSLKGQMCDRCGGNLEQRKDDSKDTVEERLRVYKLQTQPLIEYYNKLGLLRSIDGSGGLSEITSKISEVISDLK